jgi:hypothetical protein
MSRKISRLTAVADGTIKTGGPHRMIAVSAKVSQASGTSADG